MSSPRELRRRFRSLRGYRERYALGVGMVAVALRGDDPVLRRVGSFLAGRRDLFTRVELERLHADEAPAGAVDVPAEVLDHVAERGATIDAGAAHAVDRSHGQAPGTDAAGDPVVWTWRTASGGADRTTRPLWRALAEGRSGSLAREFAAWAGRAEWLMGNSRMLASLPRTAVQVSSTVRLSLCGPSVRAHDAPRPVAEPDGERMLAAWLSLAVDARWVSEQPSAWRWFEDERRGVVAVDGPFVRSTVAEAAALEVYLSASLLDRRAAACGALQRLLEEAPDAPSAAALLGSMRQLVPERDRLDGDWRDLPHTVMLAHWRLVGELGLRPSPPLLAFWRGLAVWEGRLGEDLDLAAGYQRWAAARVGGRLATGSVTAWTADVAGRLLDRLDRSLGEGGTAPGPSAARSGAASDAARRKGRGPGLVVFLGAAVALWWRRPELLPWLALLAPVAAGVGWALRPLSRSDA